MAALMLEFLLDVVACASVVGLILIWLWEKRARAPQPVADRAGPESPASPNAHGTGPTPLRKAG